MTFTLDDSELQNPLISPLCIVCARSHSIGEEPAACEAFPEGIPAEILSGEFIHTKEFTGDDGLRYKPLER